MTFQIIPAIDLKDGRCVRLKQGQSHRETVYSHEPVEVARDFQNRGAKRLHVIDLDGAFGGKPANLDIVKNICRSVDMTVEVGGGIRSINTIELILQAGAKYAILGTAACEDPRLVTEAAELYPGRIIVGIDARDGYAAVRGWVEGTKIRAVELAKRMRDVGIQEIIFTDIARDGMLSGPNLEALVEMTSLGVNVIASGGVSTTKDIKDIVRLAKPDIIGAIIGQALYTNQFTLEEAIQASGSG
ncbi:MAG: 1-(5-phosphoribosyl)-5-[(5-phosphoribosylamino)methylideneamino]imidazole-4-carboxamide isomerase [Firmicutes bacterium]|nr:1-(5-phosphoribosyl)-5-[(5-phosphoribosylamino)methylideneamino]imidazole-4-carboxamide isomerase [Bacillota bacterium]